MYQAPPLTIPLSSPTPIMEVLPTVPLSGRTFAAWLILIQALVGVRVLAALNGLELFGHERGNIEVFKTLRDLGAEVTVGVDVKSNNHVDVELRRMVLPRSRFRSDPNGRFSGSRRSLALL